LLDGDGVTLLGPFHWLVLVHVREDRYVRILMGIVSEGQ
jgi:hypothetical protein